MSAKGISMKALTPREKDVMSAIVSGLRISDIAFHLGVSANTVKTHIKGILESTDSLTVPQAVYKTCKGLWKPKESIDECHSYVRRLSFWRRVWGWINSRALA